RLPLGASDIQHPASNISYLTSHILYLISPPLTPSPSGTVPFRKGFLFRRLFPFSPVSGYLPYRNGKKCQNFLRSGWPSAGGWHNRTHNSACWPPSEKASGRRPIEPDWSPDQGPGRIPAHLRGR